MSNEVSVPDSQKVVTVEDAPEEDIGGSDNSPDYLDKIRRRMYTPSSRGDIMMMLDSKVKVITYDQISNYETLEKLLEPFYSVVMLYPNGQDESVGHWCCLFTNIGTERLEVFDSYGAYIDEPVEKYNLDVMHKKHKLEPELLKLILESKYADNTHYNDMPYQSNKVATATCGLWTVMRLKNKHLVDEEFQKIWYDLPVENGILPDLVVSDVTCHLYPMMCI